MFAESVDVAFLSSPQNHRYSQLEALLTSADQAPLPDTVAQGLEEHTLRWKSGASISDVARRRFVVGLLRESSDHEGALVRRTRPFLKDLDCYKLCRALIATAGDAPDEDWPLYILAIVGSPYQIERLGRELEEMAETDLDDAMTAVEILRRCCSTESLRWLSHWSQNSTNPELQAACRDTLVALADSQNTVPSELLEAFLPNLYFDASNERRFDYGPRTIVAHLRSDLSVAFREQDTDRTFKSAPAVHRNDDLDMAKTARTALREMLADIKRCAAQQTEVMLSAMAHGRLWPLALWRRRCLVHPVMRALSTRLVFALHRADNPPLPFSLARGGELRGLDDALIAPMPGDSIGILHPVYLDAEATEAWRVRLNARAMEAPPFEQLVRRVFRPWAHRSTWEAPDQRLPDANRIEMRRAARKLGYIGTLSREHLRSTLTRTLGPCSVSLTFEGAAQSTPIAHNLIRCVDITISRHGQEVAFEDIPAEIFSEAMLDLHTMFCV